MALVFTAIANVRMAGMSAADFSAIKNGVVRAVSRRREIQAAYIFGSVVYQAIKNDLNDFTAFIKAVGKFL